MSILHHVCSPLFIFIVNIRRGLDEEQQKDLNTGMELPEHFILKPHLYN